MAARPADNLTEKRIRDAKPGPKARVLWDATVKGLGVRVFPSGAKAFVLSYRVDGRKKLATLARCSEMSLRQARARAGRELAAIRDGEPDPLRRRQEVAEAPTVTDLLDRFFCEYVPHRIEAGRMTENTARQYTQQRRYVEPVLGRIKVADVTRADVERAIVRPGPTHRNRLAAFLSRAFTLAEHWEWRPQHTNPVRGIEKAREQPRDRVLAPSEIEALAAALGSSDELFAVAAIRFLTLTGWRSGEALALRWEHVNFETGEALLPTTKAGRQTRPLGAPALAMLADLPRVNGNPYVFAGVPGRGARLPEAPNRLRRGV